jgi:hypothetical protein
MASGETLDCDRRSDGELCGTVYCLLGGHNIFDMSRFAEIAERAFEVLLGLVLCLAAMVPIAFGVGAAFEFSAAHSEWPTWAVVLGVAASAAVAWWCLSTAWRLVTRRERRGGGLLSPTTLVLTGTACLVVSATAVVNWGISGLGRAAQFFAMSAGAFALARSRVKARRA